jgi:predicted lipoprotein with Yx(FWY)xxD motif
MGSRLWVTNAVAAAALVATACSGTTPSTASSNPPPSVAASAATIAVASNALGQILVDGKGMTIYLFVADHSTASTCYTSCAQVWPPVLTNGAPVAGTGATASLLGTTKRTDGKTEVTYNGHPLYYFVTDKKPGDTTGQGVTSFGEIWYVMSPAGAAIH